MKVVEIRNLYKNTLNEISKSDEKWIDFLKTASWNFKYNFDDQILIYAQRPNATACAEIKEWNEKVKPRRWVNKGAKGIAIFSKEGSELPLRFVFDIEDTHNFKNTEYKLWEVKPEYEEEILEALEGRFGEIDNKESFAQALMLSTYNMVTDSIQDYIPTIEKYKTGTQLEELDENDIKTLMISAAWSSVTYMIMNRCGINAEKYLDKSEFYAIKYFDNANLTTILGTATRDISEVGLREISKTIRNIKLEEKNQNRTFVKNQKMEYSKNIENKEGGNSYDENRIQTRGRLSNTEYINERGENTNREIRKNEVEFSKGEQESRIHNIEDEQRTEQTSDRDTRDGNRNEESNNRENEENRWSNREIEGNRPNEMGRSNEQLQIGSRGTNSEGIDISLTLPTEKEQKDKIVEVENTSTFSFTQEMIDKVLQEGSGFEKGKYRIYEMLTKSLSNKENAEFLKNEYGIGGRSTDENGIRQWHSAKGITLTAGKQEEKVLNLSWIEVEKRIRELISADRYFNEAEKEEYKNWLEDKENPQIEVEQEKIDSLPEEYVYSIGDRAYVGTTEYEILNMNDEKVTIADVKFPLFLQEMDYAEFDKKVKENPYNNHLKKSVKVQEEKNESVIKSEFDNWLDTFIEEKEIDPNESFTIQTPNNTHIFEIGNVIENIKATSKEEQEQIRDMIVKIDYSNGDVVDYFKHLANALAQNYEKGQEQEQKQESVQEEQKEEKIVVNIKKKRKNKIEYFDLHPEVPMENRNNYKIQDENLGVGTPKEKFTRNIAAIKILKKCEEENRYATREEQEVLSKYVGWGGIPEAFDSRNSSWATEYETLKNLLTEKEYKEAKQSTLTAFYTPPIVIQSIYETLEKMGLERGNILEPSCRYRKFYGITTRYIKRV